MTRKHTPRLQRRPSSRRGVHSLSLVAALLALSWDTRGESAVASRVPEKRTIADNPGQGVSEISSTTNRAPHYERDRVYWRQRYEREVTNQLDRFTPPSAGSVIEVVPRIGPTVRGQLRALSDATATIDGRTYRRSALTPETCSILFAPDWARSEAYRIVVDEKAAYERGEDDKWRKMCERREAQGSAIRSLLRNVSIETNDDVAVAMLVYGIETNPDAINLFQAKENLAARRQQLAQALAERKVIERAARVAAIPVREGVISIEEKDSLVQLVEKTFPDRTIESIDFVAWYIPCDPLGVACVMLHPLQKGAHEYEFTSIFVQNRNWHEKWERQHRNEKVLRTWPPESCWYVEDNARRDERRQTFEYQKSAIFLALDAGNTREEIAEVLRFFEEGKAIMENGTVLIGYDMGGKRIRRYLKDGVPHVDISWAAKICFGTDTFKLIEGKYVLVNRSFIVI